MKIINLTPHTINVLGEIDQLLRELPASGNVARVDTEPVFTYNIAGLPIFSCVVGEVSGLLSPKWGTIYIVSAMVRLAVPERTDVFSPGKLIRDKSGQPIGCRGLTRNRG